MSSWLEKVRKKSDREKFRIIWVITIFAAIILIIIWVVTGHFSPKTPIDTTVFKTIGQGIYNAANQIHHK